MASKKMTWEQAMREVNDEDHEDRSVITRVVSVVTFMLVFFIVIAVLMGILAMVIKGIWWVISL